jgi:hypothetical protein
VRVLHLSWTANGRELAYLARWTCPQHHGSPCSDIAARSGYEQVRTLDAAAGGGRLDSGRLLVDAPGDYLGAAVISPDGRTLTAVQVLTLIAAVRGPSYHEFRITKVDAPTGRTIRILDQVRTGPKDMVSSFVPSPSGPFLIVINGSLHGAGVNGWFGRGRLHRLAPAGSEVSFEAW